MTKIAKLSDIPCFQCDRMFDCDVKLERSPKLKEIQDAVFRKVGSSYKDCSIWKCMNVFDMGETEVDEW